MVNEHLKIGIFVTDSVSVTHQKLNIKVRSKNDRKQSDFKNIKVENIFFLQKLTMFHKKRNV